MARAPARAESAPARRKSRLRETDLHLGLSIRHARTLKGMRLRDLAEKSGYSESLISRIENDKTTPSLHTLHHLARALDLTVADLLSQESEQSLVVMQAGARPTIGRPALPGQETSGVVAEVMIPLGRSSQLQAFLIRLEPGASGSGKRQHEGEEVGYVVRGELLLTVGDASYSLSEGDSFFFPSRELHDFSNPGPDITEVVWTNTPATL
ncbi:cupin domain-containing protein [Enterovirga sp.]|jgi:transcriptional regulator with XRE-family HTH domain|uniref:cupin domain-containing protein n=1 Tax=Enterovirga sp. TaxID=2026350 RepID=UPI00261D3D90|nr:cupin domain-containing protein [Enterovirga sp.]MDB5591608.1 cupin protein [Enterovirga sp.]